MKTIAIFGGSGFLGTYLVDELLKRNHKVFSLDIKPAEIESEAAFLKVDILDYAKVLELFATYKFDIVYNLAGFANLDKAIEFPIDTFKLNVIGNLNIIEACRIHNVTRYIYASSAYAMSNKGSFYGISKLSSEKIIEEYQRKFNLAFTILRYGSIYSEQDFENNYIFNLVKTAIETGTINHDGDGKEVREYIHAADAAKLSADIIEDDQYIGKHLILTGVERIQRKELFDLINEILDHKIEINVMNNGYKNHYKYTPYSFSPEESQKLLPNPYIDMGQGILNCIKEVYKK